MNDYEWDESKRLSNVAKHRIDFAAVNEFEWETAHAEEVTAMEKFAMLLPAISVVVFIVSSTQFAVTGNASLAYERQVRGR